MLNKLDKQPDYNGGSVGIERLHSQPNVLLVYLRGKFAGNVKNRVFKSAPQILIEDIDTINSYLRNYALIG